MARVLILEPDSTLRRFIAGILADFDHLVSECANPRDARQCLLQAPFDLLTTDLVLSPDSAHSLASLRHMRILTLSGERFPFANPNDRRPSPLRDKPFRFADLSTLVAAVRASEVSSGPLVAAARGSP